MKFYGFVVKSIGQLRTYADPPYIPRLKDVGFTALSITFIRTKHTIVKGSYRANSTLMRSSLEKLYYQRLRISVADAVNYHPTDQPYRCALRYVLRPC